MARAGSEGNVRRVRARAMDPRPARPLVRPEDADPFAFSDQEPKMSVLRRKRNPELRKTQTGWLCGGSKSTRRRRANLPGSYSITTMYTPRANTGAVSRAMAPFGRRSTTTRRVTPLAAPGPWCEHLTLSRAVHVSSTRSFTSRGRRTRASRRTRRSLWRATRLGRTPRTSPRFRRRRTRSR